MMPEWKAEAVREAVNAAKENQAIELVVDRGIGYAVVAVLQLALRHPRLDAGKGSGYMARQFCDSLINGLSHGDGPEHRHYSLIDQMLKAGYDPTQDLEP